MARPKLPPPDYELWRRRRAEAFGEAPPPGAPAEPPAPAEPLPLPGTPLREDLLQARALAGRELHQPGDVVAAPDQRTDYGRLRNGGARKTRKRGVATTRPEPGEKPSRLRDRKTSTKKIHEIAFPYLKALGQRLRALRGRRSLGQVELASGVFRQTLHRLERGEVERPRVDTLLLLADHFKVSLDELVGRSGR